MTALRSLQPCHSNKGPSQSNKVAFPPGTAALALLLVAGTAEILDRLPGEVAPGEARFINATRAAEATLAGLKKRRETNILICKVLDRLPGEVAPGEGRFVNATRFAEARAELV